MVRCDEFYEKWQKVGNFCKKHPDTATRIDAFLDQIVGELEKIVAQSEILKHDNTPTVGIITERASSPLISEKDPEIRKEALEQIVKVAENKVMDGERPQVTEKEVTQIIEELKDDVEGDAALKSCECNAFYQDILTGSYRGRGVAVL